MRLFRFIAGAFFCLLTLPGHAEDEVVQSRAETDASRAVFRRLGSSPVEAFRKLLAMSVAERNGFLTNYPAATRERILAKLDQYQMLPPDFCDLRLRVTELRWYLLPLLKAPADQRTEKLKSVPEPYKELVKQRLDEWDIWPPSLKDEVLEYQTTFSCFVGRDAAGNAVALQQTVFEDLSEKDRLGLERKLAEWQALPKDERLQLFACFEHYFELSEEEKEKTLDALSEPQRHETEKVLDPIEKRSKPQKEAYMAAFRQFAEMSPEQRQNFMKSAERWQKMSPAERQAWRDLVQQLSVAPPVPPGVSLPRVQPVGLGPSAPIKTNPAAATPK